MQTRQSLQRAYCCAFLVLAVCGFVQPVESFQEADELLPPEQAAATMRVPEGFNVTLFAGEPDVLQPIGFCIDDRGRLWIAEAFNYPVKGKQSGDRIVILEDTDADGRFDERTVFYDQLNYVTGIEVGFGGAWVMSPPNFYFIPDRDGDDRPDGEPQVILDGFGVHANAHNLANGLAWGPDGWLYGTHGRTNWSMIGKPATPQNERMRFDGGVYRYHPTRDIWEPFADGTTNPWGIDWDDYGQAFICNCVNPHLFHVIQGAHYEPWRNRRSSQFAYRRIPTIADHLHFLGGGDVRAGIGSDQEIEAGGGHAHCGLMVYLGDNWPEQYRNSVFMNNIHGRRINNDTLKRSGSGYIASHGRDVMISNDPWYMGVTLAYGPDGSVFASDWSDTGECHSVRNTQRQTGRIYKISFGTPKSVSVDITKHSNLELADLQLHRNDWHVRHARRLLQERAANGVNMSPVHRRLRAMFAEQPDATRKLRALWALHVTGGLSNEFLLGQLGHADEYVRAWCVRLLCEGRDPPEKALAQFHELAAAGESQLVRLHLASALQRLRHEQRWPIATALLSRSIDAEDPNLPLMYWYAIQPLIEDNLAKFVSLAASTEIPLIRRHIARRAVSSRDTAGALSLVLSELIRSDDATLQSDLLSGILGGIAGRRRLAMPEVWSKAYEKLSHHPSTQVRQQALQLAVIFDDPKAMETLRRYAGDVDLPAGNRIGALETLVTRKAPNLDQFLFEQLSSPVTRRTAIRGLAEYSNLETPARLISIYEILDRAARQDVIQTLASRVTWAMQLMDAIESNQIPRSDLTAWNARQLRSLEDESLTTRVKSVWGEVRKTPRERAKSIEDYRKKLTRKFLDGGNRQLGREIYKKNCANCHKLFGDGEDVGPDLTGSQRGNLDYMLENLIDPNATVSNDYMMSIFQTSDGRVITGLVLSENETVVTIQTANEKLILPVAEIEARRRSRLSVMPEGLLNDLSIEQVRDLMAYLANPQNPSRKN